MSARFGTYLPWFILNDLPLLGNALKKKLIQHFESPEAVLDAPGQELSKISGMTDQAIRAILKPGPVREKAQTELEAVLDKGILISVWSDPDYPALLKEIPDPPMVMTYQGRLSRESPCIALVGSRQATGYGRETARTLAARLAEQGFTVVSGMAQGIDTAAHQGALDGGGATLAVMGSGFNQIYPRQNRPLAERIAARGAVLTEFSLNDPPLARHFPVRNRIIAGICCGTVVVEAAQRSGSLITARLAGEYNREVFAVPGSIRSSRSRGTHALIRQGAHLVETEQDIIDQLAQFVHAEARRSESFEERPSAQEIKKTGRIMDKDEALVYKHLDPYPRHIDFIIDATGLDISRVLVILTEWELSGRVHRHPGNLFSLSEE